MDERFKDISPEPNPPTTEERIKSILKIANTQISKIVLAEYPDADSIQTVCGWNVGDASHEVDVEAM